MRQIKFRAWVTGQDGPYMAIQGEPDLETLQSFMFHYGSESNLMQFTGLLDKNGEEIFEGDICKYSYISPMDNEEKTYLWRVEYSPGVFWLRSIEGKKYDTPLWIKASKVEIVGNIHDNPDLLGGESDG